MATQMATQMEMQMATRRITARLLEHASLATLLLTKTRLVNDEALQL
jgi:hypothetical protein